MYLLYIVTVIKLCIVLKLQVCLQVALPCQCIVALFNVVTVYIYINSIGNLVISFAFK